MLINQFPDKSQFLKLAGESNVVPVCVEMLADTETPVSLLRKKYKQKRPIFLFESVEGGERWGRYSFLGISARTRILVYQKNIEVIENSKVKHIPHNGDPLSVLRDLMNRYRPAQLSGLPRFWGGMVGYLTYEMVSFFESIPHLLPDDKPLAHFIIPDEIIVFDNIRHTLLGIVISFLDKEENADDAFSAATERIKILLQELEQPAPEKHVPAHPPNYILETSWKPEAFRSLVRTIKDHILAGDVIQTVNHFFVHPHLILGTFTERRDSSTLHPISTFLIWMR
jgi:anthranilate synthase component I